MSQERALDGAKFDEKFDALVVGVEHLKTELSRKKIQPKSTRDDPTKDEVIYSHVSDIVEEAWGFASTASVAGYWSSTGTVLAGSTSPRSKITADQSNKSPQLLKEGPGWPADMSILGEALDTERRLEITDWIPPVDYSDSTITSKLNRILEEDVPRTAPVVDDLLVEMHKKRVDRSISLIEAKEYQKAIQTIKKDIARMIQPGSAGTTPGLVAESRMLLARAYNESNQSKEALATLKEILIDVSGLNEATICTVNFTLAEITLRDLSMTESEIFALNATTGWFKLHGKEHPEYLKCVKLLIKLYETLDDHEEAELWKEELPYLERKSEQFKKFHKFYHEVESLVSEQMQEKAAIAVVDYLSTNYTISFAWDIDKADYVTLKWDEIRKTIQESKRKALCTTGFGLAPIHFLAMAKPEAYEEIEFLINEGASPASTWSIPTSKEKEQDGQTVLMGAVRCGNSQVVDLLINSGVDITAKNAINRRAADYVGQSGNTQILERLLREKLNFCDVFGSDIWTALHLASFWNHPKTCVALLDSGMGIHHKTGDYGQSPLHIASETGHLAVIDVLIEYGANINATDNSGSTPLHEALNADTLKLLLKYGADPNVQEQNRGNTKLMWCCIAKDMASITALIENGANPNVTSVHNATAILLASEIGEVQIAELLMDNGADLGIANSTAELPIHVAAANGNEDMVEFLLQRGSPVDSLDQHGKTPFYRALEKGHIQTARILLSNGADGTCSPADYAPPTHLAAEVDASDILNLLIEQGAKINGVNGSHEQKPTPLHVASKYRSESCVDYLLKQGANPNAKMMNGMCPLHYAALNSHLSISRYLIDAGANVMALDALGNTPLIYSARECDDRCTELFLKNDAKVGVSNLDGVTALGCAVHNKCVRVIELLVRNGADLNCGPSNGFGNLTPLEYALKNGDDATITALVDLGASTEHVEEPKMLFQWAVRYDFPSSLTNFTTDSLACQD